jgi:hypothetical protein
MSYWDGEIYSSEGRSDVRRHVVVALRSVDEEWITVRHEAGKECLQVPAHVRVGILLNQERGRSVLDMERQQAVIVTVLR